MKKYLLAFIALMLTSCVATSLEERYGKKSYCEKIGALAGIMTVNKWRIREITPAEKLQYIDYRILVKTQEKNMVVLGISVDHIIPIAKLIYETDLMLPKDYDILSFAYYAEENCKINKNEVLIKNLNDFTPMINDCWENNQINPAQTCISNMLQHEIPGQ